MVNSTRIWLSKTWK